MFYPILVNSDHNYFDWPSYMLTFSPLKTPDVPLQAF